jgi:peptide/nickel transport system substrate-binding protein
MRSRRRTPRLLALALASSLALVACGGGDTDASDPAAPTHLSVGMSAVWRSWDPAESLDGDYVVYLDAVYDTLLTVAPDGVTVGPGIAEEFSYDEALTTLTLSVRDGLTFPDGTALDANAVVTGLGHLKAGTGAAAGYLANVTGVTAPDATTVVLTLATPDPLLTANLAGVAGMIVNPGFVDDPSLAEAPQGSGPYLLDAANSVPGSTFSFDRNPDYWNSEAYAYDTVDLDVLEDATARTNAITAGQVDVVTGSNDMVDRAEAAGLQVLTTPGPWTGFVMVDKSGAIEAPYGDVRVRQAINYAFDVDAIIDSVQQGRATESRQIFSPESNGYVEALNDTYDYDPAKAKQLLAEAGYPNGFTTHLFSWETISPYVPIIDKYLGDIGITVEWTQVQGSNVGATVGSLQYPMWFFSLATSPNSWKDVLFNVAPDGRANFAKYSTPEVDAALQKIRTATGEDQATALQELDTLLVQDAWFAPLFVADNVLIADDDVTVQMQAGQATPFLSNFSPAE